jgi:1-acyl-sn-glycerol-3-phosphate acyltransferase
MELIPQSNFKRFDFNKKPKRQQFYLMPLTWILSYPSLWKHHTKIERINMKGLKPPYLLLCNHNSFLDFKVTTAAIFPSRANYVVAIDGFIKREWLLRNVGCICKRKFTNDITMVRHLRRVVENGDVVVLYPEARYSLCGTNAVMPESLGKLAKFLKVPVVTLISHGHHINSPFWNLKERGNRTEATLKQLVTAEEINTLSYEEINKRINDDFVYDDFAWQKTNRIKVTYKDRAKGLHKVLYQCPNCMAEYHMMSDGNRIWCDDCKKVWTMSEYGELSAVEGTTEFPHIPDWYEWERAQVRKEVKERRYYFSAPVMVQSLPNSKGFISLGKGVLTHDSNGFNLTGSYNGQPYQMKKSVNSLYSCHIEYDYLGKYGDCIDLNTLSDTYYIYPKDCDFSVTKIALATEELYNWEHSSASHNKTDI